MASLFKRRKQYWVSFYLDGKHVRRSLKTTTEKVAKAKVRRIEYELEIGDLQMASKLHLATILQAFCRHLMATRTYKSYKNDFSRLRIFFGPICEELEIRPPGPANKPLARPRPDKYAGKHAQAKFLEDVTPQVINRFLAAREEQNGWSPKTANLMRQEALRDPTLERTEQELEVAMTNAATARSVVSELFQDLDKFNLGDYQKFDDEGRGMQRLVAFVQRSAQMAGGEFRSVGEDIFELRLPGQNPALFTTDRDKALDSETMDLLGLEHPIVSHWLEQWSALGPEERAVCGSLDGTDDSSGLLTFWSVVVNAPGGQNLKRVIRLALDWKGNRSATLENAADRILQMQPGNGQTGDQNTLHVLANDKATEILHRDLIHSGVLQDGASYSSRLLGSFAAGGRQSYR
ncbi:MAG: hypothetical protein GXO73_01835 [Calditrichaeota bacterium]|nr:hypothetical protein [Calditrichota bacterium]